MKKISKNIFFQLGVVLVVMLLMILFPYWIMESKNDVYRPQDGNNIVVNESNQVTTEVTHQCIPKREDLALLRTIPSVVLRQGETISLERKRGEIILWCCDNGDIQQLTKNGDTRFTIKGIADVSHVHLACYRKK